MNPMTCVSKVNNFTNKFTAIKTKCPFVTGEVKAV